MTTYKKYSIKNRKTRKIKTFKGGGAENDIKKVAIDTVNTKISTGATGNTPVKSGKKVSILIDFYEKLLKPENYGNNLNFNEFYEIVNINKNGINTAESITGVEELFEIFKKEIKYIKATDEENKVETEKDLKSNLKKTKEIIIDYRDSRKFTIDGEKGAAAPPVSVTRAPPGAVTLPVTAPVPSTVVPEPSTEEKMQEIAKNTVIKETALNLDDSTLVKLYNEIKTNTKTFNKNNSTIASNENEIEKLQKKIEKLNTENEKNREQLKVITDNIIQKNKIATKIGKNNQIIDTFKSNIETLKNTDFKRHNEDFDKLKSQKDNYLKLLNRAYDILTQELSNMKLVPGYFVGVKSTKEYDDIQTKMQTIQNKIYNLNYGKKRFSKTEEKVSSSDRVNSTPMTPETTITKAAIKAVNDAVNAANPETAITKAAIKAVNDAVNAANP